MVNNETSVDNGPASPVAIGIMATIYIAIFLTSELGNGFVIFSLLVRKRKSRTAMEEFVLSLATTDFLFTTLSLFNGMEYILDEWKFGVVACKIHAQLLEVTYTVSTLTLATISYTRHKAANADNPFKLLHKRPKVKRNIALVWSTSFIFSLPLFYGYTVVTRDGSLHCTNVNFNEVTRQTYYLVQAVLLFVVPITIMIVSQRLTTRSLRSHSQNQAADSESTNQSAIATRAVLSEQRITKLLTCVWIIFACCWTPFVTYRAVDYFVDIRKRGQVWNQLWHMCQVLILLNSAINPLLYHRMAKRSRGVLTQSRCARWGWCCLRRDKRRRQVVDVTMGTMGTTLQSRSQ